jgi:hypothetical protein
MPMLTWHLFVAGIGMVGGGNKGYVLPQPGTAHPQWAIIRLLKKMNRQVNARALSGPLMGCGASVTRLIGLFSVADRSAFGPNRGVPLCIYT